jgi:hypothetical protein
MPRHRPGFKLATVVENGREATVWQRDRDDASERTQEQLAAELAGAVYMGEKTEGSPAVAGRPASVVRFDVFVDLDNPYKSWRRYADGTIVRNFSAEPGPSPEPMGVVKARYDGDSATDAAFGPTQPREATIEEPNPFDGVDPATQRAISAALGLRR